MRFGIVSDIHCNLAGLEAALVACGPIDELLCLGDVVLEHRFSDELVQRLQDLNARVVIGNHDVGYFKHAAARDIERGRADPDLVAWLAAQPETVTFEAAGQRVLMTHATPWTQDYVFPGSPQMHRFAEVDADFVLGGHTHATFAGRVGEVMVINPGSAGQARATDAGAMLSCAVLDLNTGQANLLTYAE